MKPPAPFESIWGIENLYLAWYKTARGKASKAAIQDFYRSLDANLADIAADLRNGAYTPGPYRHFLITDPKERLISASPVRDRVVQHALMNLYAPVFERSLITDTYACRPGKGTGKAMLRAFHFAKGQAASSPDGPGGSAFFLKMDVRRYFDSINHGVLKALLRPLVRDARTLSLFFAIIDSYSAGAGKGVPIGNLSSQYFANLYLSGFDHYLKEQCGVRRYVRYMDDMLIFSGSGAALAALHARAVSYCSGKLDLALKPPVLGPVKNGAPFLGFLIKPSGLYLQRKSKNRYRARIAAIEHGRKTGALSPLEAGRRAEAVTAHLAIARARSFRNTVLKGRVLGYEPREPRRELEQYGPERPFRQPEQQHPGEPEQ